MTVFNFQLLITYEANFKKGSHFFWRNFHCVLFCKTLAQTSVVHQKKSFPKSISCYTMPSLKGLKSYLAKHCGREVHQIVLNLPNISDVLWLTWSVISSFGSTKACVSDVITPMAKEMQDFNLFTFNLTNSLVFPEPQHVWVLESLSYLISLRGFLAIIAC